MQVGGVASISIEVLEQANVHLANKSLVPGHWPSLTFFFLH